MAGSEMPPGYEAVEVTIDGRKHSGRYIVERGLITVTDGRRTISTEVGTKSPAYVARKALEALIAGKW